MRLVINSVLEINSLSWLYLSQTNQLSLHRTLPCLYHLTYQYLAVKLDKPSYPYRYWSDRVLHPYKIRYAAIDVWVLWSLNSNLVERLQMALGASAADAEIRTLTYDQVLRLTVGGYAAALK
ncbi:hypothetical protein HK097_008995 [Rhizophlyctis rosea]|uniref:Uncharacterized protein n=1 Tax=Rhizophlyctis rosea TaxID=64517 RepID=A0AAD5S9P8_9FUNG|nr:hypothetical protein HK097_008995 [Rhizophlyctis rosea]